MMNPQIMTTKPIYSPVLTTTNPALHILPVISPNPVTDLKAIHNPNIQNRYQWCNLKINIFLITRISEHSCHLSHIHYGRINRSTWNNLRKYIISMGSTYVILYSLWGVSHFGGLGLLDMWRGGGIGAHLSRWAGGQYVSRPETRRQAGGSATINPGRAGAVLGRGARLNR